MEIPLKPWSFFPPVSTWKRSPDLLVFQVNCHQSFNPWGKVIETKGSQFGESVNPFMISIRCFRKCNGRGDLRVWGSWCWTGRLPSLSRTRHRGTLLVTVVRFCPLVASLLSWYKSHCPCSKSYNYIVLYIYIHHIILITDYYILIYIIWLWLYVSYIIFNFWLLYLNQTHFFTKNPQQSSTIPSTGMEQEGEPGNPQENHDCRQVHFRESSEWLAATSQVARYKNYKTKEWRSHLVMQVANKLRWRIDILNLCFPNFCLLQHCYLSKGLGLKLLDFPSTWRVRVVLRRKIFATRSCAVEDFLKQHRPWGVTFL